MLARNLWVAYVAFVGIPLLGLIGILDAGRDLRAPFAIGGAWNVQGDWKPLLSNLCGVWTESSQDRTLEISQSGKYLSVTFDSLQGSGFIEASRVTAGQLRPNKRVSCSQGEVSLNVTARYESANGVDALIGTVAVNGCASCAPVPFRAVRRGELKAER